ncbi:MAG: pimeloyl-ACP methyl ester carboxylesterase [Halieaceae bacterium]|jgi:pimeloyl-ACP methyl ester carboxylesterase
MNLKPPHWLLAFSDAPRALLDAACLGAVAPLLQKMPKGDGQGVMIMPGFMGDDRGNQPLIRFLCKLGYRARGWGQGRNLGPSSFSPDKLRASIEELAAAGDGKVSLIGHSLGGIYAREIAKMEPASVHQVITLGSPFGKGRGDGSHADKMYQRLNPQFEPRDDDDILCIPPPVPTTAIYTRADGIVNWRTSMQQGTAHQVHNIEVLGSHIGLNLNAAVWYWVAKKLAAV